MCYCIHIATKPGRTLHLYDLSRSFAPDRKTHWYSRARPPPLQGTFDEAERLFLRAIKIAENSRRLDHHEVAVSLSNLAGLFTTQVMSVNLPCLSRTTIWRDGGTCENRLRLLSYYLRGEFGHSYPIGVWSFLPRTSTTIFKRRRVVVKGVNQ